jgi:hypothetical protein
VCLLACRSVTTSERITLDTTVARDMTDRRRSGHPYALELLAMAERGEVELMIAPQGRRLDVTYGDLLDQVQALIDEHVPEARQVARLSEATYPSDSAFPGAIVQGFDEAWDEVALSWERNGPKDAPPGRKDRFHVETHLLEQRNVFVTNDAALIRMCDRLRDEHSLLVIAARLQDYVASRRPSTA